MRKYKFKGKVWIEGKAILVEQNQYTRLITPKRSNLNKKMKLETGDIVEIIVVKK